MKSRAIVLTLALALAGMFSAALAREATTYKSTVAGRDVTSPTPDTASYHCEASGDLPGAFRFTVSYDRAGGAITGGEWTLSVTEQDAEGVAVSVGQLSGAVTGGTATFGPDGKLASLSGIQLNITGGEGRYAGVTAGAGTLDRAEQGEAPFNGALSLTF